MIFIEKLQQAITDEITAYHFYKRLLKETDDPLYVDFIGNAAEDENKHYEWFQYIHYLLTNHYYKPKQRQVSYTTFEAGIEMALKDEQKAAEFYREMLFEIPIEQAYYPFFRAMTDEREHGTHFSTTIKKCCSLY